MYTLDVSTAVLERKLIDARHSARENHTGGEKRRIFEGPPFTRAKLEYDYIISWGRRNSEQI
jgi:hypothetical protein